MFSVTGTRLTIGVAALGAMLSVNAAPAEAGPRGFGGALAAGIIGGIAVNMIAAAAEAQALQRGPIYAALPEFGGSESMRAPARLAPKRAARMLPRELQSKRAESPVNACRDYLTSASRPYGSVRVTAESAGRAVQATDGATSVPVRATVEYARQGRSQVRKAVVTCEINAKGQAVALHSRSEERHASGR
jgi:hypothetical protein